MVIKNNTLIPVTIFYLLLFFVSSLFAGKAENEEIVNLRYELAEFRTTLEEINEKIKTLYGRIEAIEYKLQHRKENTDTKKTEESIRGNREKILQIEKQLSLISGKPENDIGEEDSYKKAKDLFDKEKMEKAQTAFTNFIVDHPDSDRCDNARFWLGEIEYRKAQYRKAILEYQKVIEQYPSGNKVPAALLKQGISFHRINEKENAIVILKELIKKYPNSNEAKEAKVKLDAYRKW